MSLPKTSGKSGAITLSKVTFINSACELISINVWSTRVVISNLFELSNFGLTKEDGFIKTDYAFSMKALDAHEVWKNIIEDAKRVKNNRMKE